LSEPLKEVDEVKAVSFVPDSQGFLSKVPDLCDQFWEIILELLSELLSLICGWGLWS
jgi:hypothetical protein